MNINIDKKIFCPIYRPYIQDYSKRYEVYYGGRASGKTKFVFQKLLLKGLTEKRLILLMRKQTNQLRDSVWKELLSIIDEWKLTPYFDFNKSEFRAICKINGTEFKCLGLDESEKIKGFADMSDVLIDECTAFNLEDCELIDGTLRSPKYKLPLQIFYTFNPISKQNWVYKNFGFDTGKIPENTFILKSTYLDNPFLDKVYAERMDLLKVRNPNRWRIEALGDFVTLDKLVYNNWSVKDFDYHNIVGDLLIGIDFGFSQDLATVVASIVNKDEHKLYIFQDFGKTGLTNKDLANVIKSLGFSKSIIIADSAEPKSIEELKREGIVRIRPSIKGKDSILYGINKLLEYEIIVNPNCDGVITELENYSWQKDKQTGEYINKPIDSFNHYLDALRYSLQIIDNDKKLKSISKDLL